jgi:pimeloyl-ACP methyl ester carboxylesterase
MIERFVEANGLRFHVVEDGPADGPLVLLLHGFPEFWYSWRHLLPALAKRGVRAVAPDMRGYHLTDKPASIGAYDLDHLAADVVGLIEALGAERAVLVGHDWGGAVAWHVGARHPERLTQLVIVSSPHPGAVAAALFRSLRLLLAAWYLFWFQIPGLPERWIVRRGVGDGLRRHAARPEAFTDEDVAAYDAAARVPGAMRSAVHYYRAALRGIRRAGTVPPVSVPTLVIWGAEDAAYLPVLNEDLERFVAAPIRVEVLPGVGHFVAQEAPADLDRLLGDVLPLTRTG